MRRRIHIHLASCRLRGGAAAAGRPVPQVGREPANAAAHVGRDGVERRRRRAEAAGGAAARSRGGGRERRRAGTNDQGMAPRRLRLLWRLLLPTRPRPSRHRQRRLAGASCSSGREANSSGEGGNGKDGGAAECASVSLQRASLLLCAALGSDLASLTCGPLVKSATSFFFLLPSFHKFHNVWIHYHLHECGQC